MVANNTQVPGDGTTFVEVATPKAVDAQDRFAQQPTAIQSNPNATISASTLQSTLRPNWILYTSVLVALLQPLQSGWSTSQMNLTTFSDQDECDARPVAEGTCLMFSGHSKLEWTFAVNGWILGGMIGSLACGQLSDMLGRKRVLTYNCAFMVVGAIVQLSVSNIWWFTLGRLISGIASGCATGVVGAFINEISPPHLRNALGVGLQISVTVGILLVGLTFFFANTSSGWRYIAGFPIVLAGLFLFFAPFAMVESPGWLLMKGRREDAEQVLARLFGQENVKVALAWIEESSDVEQGSVVDPDPVKPASQPSSTKQTLSMLLSASLRRQFLVAIGLSCAQQLSGINAVFYYSSSMFQDAGISDDRVGTLIIDIVNVLPTLFAGVLAIRYGNRNMLLVGMIAMFISAIGMTVSLVVSVSALSIVFTATYVAGFGISLGPLVWVLIADLFPDNVRATASSVCIGVNWLCNLIVGVSYPYIADAFNDYGFVPFVVTLAFFYLFVFQTVPETSGKSTEEIQAEFRNRTNAAPRSPGTNSSESVGSRL